MEENIHDDKLDDYVRKSFEDYEEDPSTDMWSRVEGELPPVSDDRRPVLWLPRYGWQAVAAAIIVVLFSTLICGRLYYEEKLRVLSEKTAPGQETSSTNWVPELLQTNANPLNPSTQQPASNVLDKNNTQRSTHSSISAPAVLSKEPEKQPVIALSPKVLLEKQDVVKPREPMPQAQSSNFVDNSSTANLEQAVTPAIQPSNIPDIPLDLISIPISNPFMERSMARLTSLTERIIVPVQKPNHWYLGIQTSLLFAHEKTHTPTGRPGRPAFKSKQEGAGFSSIYWLKAGKKGDGPWFLESGLGYQKTTRAASHTPRFRFGDGIHQGQNGNRRGFNYDLNTYGGTAEVSLRMEQTTGGPPSDDEPVGLKINTTERTELLRIPVLAGYRFGKGRWQGQTKAGFVGNFMLKNELDISALVSQNARFQPVMGTDGYTLQLNPKKFFLGYWLSAGMEFKLNQQLSFVAESALLGDFARKDNTRRRLPERYLLGLNVGANYYF